MSAHAEHYNGKVLTSILGLIHVYEIQLCSWTGLIAQLVDLSMYAGGLRFNPWCGHFSLNTSQPPNHHDHHQNHHLRHHQHQPPPSRHVTTTTHDHDTCKDHPNGSRKVAGAQDTSSQAPGMFFFSILLISTLMRIYRPTTTITPRNITKGWPPPPPFEQQQQQGLRCVTSRALGNFFFPSFIIN